MKKIVREWNSCANCGACVNICAHHAIAVQKDGLFYQPIIDEEKCVDCGLCKAVCPIDKEKPAAELKGAWWGCHRNPAVVRTSSSGGAFSALAEHVLAQGGVVFGAAFATDGRIVHLRSTEEVSLEELKRSKYVESQVGDAFRKIKAFLQQGRLVLICATPCQIAGLQAFLGKPYDNLVTCDFACGGLPSHSLYEQYLVWLEKRYGGKVVSVDFRPKTYGWTLHSIKVCFDNGKKYVSPSIFDPYFSAFIHQKVSIRPNCCDCRFAEMPCSDLNLADFWKYRSLSKEKRNETGLSLVLAVTEKGQKLLEKLSETMDLKPLDVEAAAYNLKAKEKNDSLLQKRQKYLDVCEREGFEAGIALLAIPSGKKALKMKWKCLLKKALYGVK